MSQETQEMNQGQAVNVLIQAARIAQQKGAFTLGDASLIHKALQELMSSFPQPSSAEVKEDPAA